MGRKTFSQANKRDSSMTCILKCLPALGPFFQTSLWQSFIHAETLFDLAGELRRGICGVVGKEGV